MKPSYYEATKAWPGKYVRVYRPIVNPDDIDALDDLLYLIYRCIDIKNRIDNGREAPGEWSELHRLAEEIKAASYGLVEIKLGG